jgi:hypothetical protein
MQQEKHAYPVKAKCLFFLRGSSLLLWCGLFLWGSLLFGCRLLLRSSSLLGGGLLLRGSSGLLLWGSLFLGGCGLLRSSSFFLWGGLLLRGSLWLGSDLLLVLRGELEGALDLDEFTASNTRLEGLEEGGVEPLLVLGELGLHQLLDGNGGGTITVLELQDGGDDVFFVSHCKGFETATWESEGGEMTIVR